MSSKRTALDLFAGAGGLSLGFELAGFSILGAVEIDGWAANTYRFNHPKTPVFCSDIRSIPDSIFNQFSGVDVVMGGPPCQGFSISASNRRKPNDERNFLYRHFLRAVEVTRPHAVVIENVREITRARISPMELLLDDLVKRLINLEYTVDYSILNAADYGIPQERFRFFLIASLSGKPCLSELPKSHGQNDLFVRRKPYLTLWDAISDLPEVNPWEVKEDQAIPYAKAGQNEYQQRMRQGSDMIYNHVPMRHTKRIVERFKLIPMGGDMNDVPGEHWARSRGNSANLSGRLYSQNHRRLDANLPCKTITASFYSSFVHPYQHRNLTVREAARIQGFPDVYRFTGKRTRLSHKLLTRKGIKEDLHLDQFNQVGNAVPPPLAEVLARYISSSCLVGK
jgi:DNA (cytosine-5)-methyltransferase 1